MRAVLSGAGLTFLLVRPSQPFMFDISSLSPVPPGWTATMVAAAGVTLLVAIGGFTLGIVVGGIVAAAKLSSIRGLRFLADIYSTVIRGTPDLLIIYLFYFGASTALGAVFGLFGHEGFVEVPPLASGMAAIGIVSGAYQGEVYRGAYRAIPRGELEAAEAIGMTDFVKLRRIIMPQTLRFAIPGLGNVWQLVLKESALVSVTGLVELMRQAAVGAGSTREPFNFYLLAAALYLVITSLSTTLFNRAEARAMRGVRRSAG